VKLGDLSLSEAADRLRRHGLGIAQGPFAIRYRISVDAAHDSFYRLYRHHRLVPEDGFIDSLVVCRARPEPRRPWRRRVITYIDGRFHAAFPQLWHAVPAVEWTTNWSIALRSQRYVVLHAAVVERDGRALIMPAPPGSGKSTLCAALANRGWRLFCDEFTLIRPEDGTVIPCPRPVSLKEGAIDAMRRFAPAGVLERVFPGTGKGTVGYALPPEASVARMADGARPGRILLPRWQADATLSLEAMSARDVFVSLNLNAVNYDVVGEPAARTLVDLASNCPAYRLTYASLDEAVDAVDRLAS
jgi:hypothetical protein